VLSSSIVKLFVFAKIIISYREPSCVTIARPPLSHPFEPKLKLDLTEPPPILLPIAAPTTMLSTTRTRAAQLLRRRLQNTSPALRTYATSEKGNEVPVTTAKKDIPNVSATDAAPTESAGIGMAAESVRKAEELRVRQAPNRDVTWSRSQNPREKAMSGPRFEQTLMEFQVRWLRQLLPVCVNWVGCRGLGDLGGN
jgi:hypothetical protein